MDYLLGLHLVLSFLIGAAFVMGCTVAAERLGTTWGGIIGGFPSTVAVTLVFVGLAVSPTAAAEATDMVPLVVGFNGVFLCLYAALAPRGLLISISLAMLAWSLLSIVALSWSPSSLSIILLVYATLLVTSFVFLQSVLRVTEYRGKRIRLSFLQLTTRAVFSGAVIAIAVLCSKLASPLVGGVFAAFPAIFLTTLTIAHRAHGPDFARGLTKPLLVSGMVNVVVFAMAVRFAYPPLGIALGTTLAYLISCGSAYTTYRFLRWNRDRTANGEE